MLACLIAVGMRETHCGVCSITFGGSGRTGFLRALREEPLRYVVPRSKGASPACIAGAGWTGRGASGACCMMAGFLRWLHSLREVRHRSAFVVTNASIDFMSIVSDAHPRVPGRGR